MNDDRIHRAVSDDGMQIAGRVYGHGPPLVLVHSGLGDDLSWGPMSVGEPVDQVGYCLGGALALGATAHSSAVSAVAVYEAAVFEAQGDTDPSRVEDRAARLGQAVAEERLVDAALTMVEGVLTDDEASSSGSFASRGLPDEER